jgi:hypothetical protein
MKVRIYQPIQQLMQRGHNDSAHWLIEHEPESRRYPEPLMGWTASSDTLNQVKLTFKTLDEAKQFAQKKGWDYTISAEHKRKTKPRNYIDNFKTRGDREAL